MTDLETTAADKLSTRAAKSLDAIRGKAKEYRDAAQLSACSHRGEYRPPPGPWLSSLTKIITGSESKQPAGPNAHPLVVRHQPCSAAAVG